MAKEPAGDTNIIWATYINDKRWWELGLAGCGGGGQKG